LLSYVERVKFHFLSFGLMNIRNVPDKSNNNRLGKAKSAIPIAGIVAAAALMSGLLFSFDGEIAIAQQNMTGTNATAANATAANAPGAVAGNQTANPPMPGGNNTEGTTGGEASTGGGQAGGDGSSDPLAGIFGGGQ
jgi:uncharacterized membrane protein YgcG